LENLKSALRSNYHAVREKYAHRYLAEFQSKISIKGFHSTVDVCFAANATDARAIANFSLALGVIRNAFIVPEKPIGIRAQYWLFL